jgi:cytoskeletal protein RodZ
MDVGARLRTARETLGLSLASVAQRTRVQPRILAAIEQNDLPSIPPKPFGRGFVRAYAQEVGLDPDLTVRDYFAQFVVVPTPGAVPREPAVEPWPSRPVWLVPAAGLVVVVLVGLALMRGRAESPSTETGAAPIGTAGQGLAAQEPVPAEPTRAEVSPPVNTANDELAIVLQAERECWVSATADDRRVLYQLMTSGTRQELRAVREIVLRVGDAGALRMTVNGREAGRLGGDGEVRTVRITPADAAKFVPVAAVGTG